MPRPDPGPPKDGGRSGSGVTRSGTAERSSNASRTSFALCSR
jgi:hypothetical protein